MLTRIKYDMAALATNNRDDLKVSCKELLQYVFVWGTLVSFSVTAAGVDFATDHAIFGYGMNDICFVTKPKAVFLAVVVPTAITVIINILTTLMSTLLMIDISKHGSVSIGSVKSILTYLGRLMAFQSIQWVFGLIYYWLSNQIARFIFSFLSSYEGLFIFFVVYTSKG